MDCTECKLKFQIFNMMHRFLSDPAPAYFSNLISGHSPSPTTHSAPAITASLCCCRAAFALGKALSRAFFPGHLLLYLRAQFTVTSSKRPCLSSDLNSFLHFSLACNTQFSTLWKTLIDSPNLFSPFFCNSRI